MRNYLKVVIFILCVVTSFLAGNFDGFERGTVLNSGIHSSDGTGYSLVAECYLLLTLGSCLLAIRVFSYARKWSALALIGAIPLFGYSFYYLVLQKMLTLKVQSEYTRLMSDAIVYDIGIGILLLLVVSYEMFTLIRVGSESENY